MHHGVTSPVRCRSTNAQNRMYLLITLPFYTGLQRFVLFSFHEYKHIRKMLNGSLAFLCL